MKNFFKKSPLSLKIILLTFAIIILFVCLLSIFPRDYRGKTCGFINLSDLSSLVFALGAFLSGLAALREFIVEKKKTLLRKMWIIIVSAISILYFSSLMGSSSGSGRERSLTMATKSNVYFFRVAQEIFYDEKGRYAGSQEELINSGILDKPVMNLVTEKELTDKDGQGIEGGDDDPNTWSVSAFFPRVKIGKRCKVINEGYWFTCDQTGECYEEELFVR